MQIEKRNPYKDAAPARAEHDVALKILNTTFHSVERIGNSLSQLYKVNNEAYILIKSAPSALNLKSIISNTVRRYGKLPFYVLFTRDVETWPTFQTYYSKMKSLYNMKRTSFRGCVVSTSELGNSNIIKTIKEGKMLNLSMKRMQEANVPMSLEDYLRNEYNLSPSRLEEALNFIEWLKLKDS